MSIRSLRYLPFGAYSIFRWLLIFQQLFADIPEIQSQIEHVNSGDFRLIGIFSNSLHFNATSRRCSQLSTGDIQLTQAMIYALNNIINNNTKLLPGINLGWTLIDSCSSREVAITKLASHLIQDKQRQSYLAHCQNGRNLNSSKILCRTLSASGTSIEENSPGHVVGVVGERSDFITTSLASLTSSLGYSQISYFSISSLLSDRKHFPYFYRTSASSTIHRQIIFDIVKVFQWNWISIVIAGTAEVENSYQMISTLAQTHGICYHTVSRIYDNYTTSDLIDIVTKWKSQSNSRVAVLFGQESIIYDLLKQAEAQNVVGITFVGTYNWLSSPRIHTIRAEIIGGAIGITFSNEALHGFKNYLNQLDFCNNLENPWFIELCREKLNHLGLDFDSILENCTVDRVIKQEVLNSFFKADFVAGYVIDATLAYAQALHKALGCNTTHCPSGYNTSFNRQQFNKVLRNIRFTGVTSPDITFRSDGAVESYFDVINLQRTTSNSQAKVKIVEVGYWNKTQGLMINKRNIIWNGNRSWFNSPLSKCSSDCPPGYYLYQDPNISLSLRPCCWKCRKCPQNMISNESNSPHCQLCPDVTLPNDNNTKCADPVLIQSKFDRPLAITFIILASANLFVVMGIWIVMIRHRNFPVVKGSNFILINILLLFIIACIPTAFLYILPPSIPICLARMFSSTTSQVVFAFPITIHHEVTNKQLIFICQIPNRYSSLNLIVWLCLIGSACLVLAFRARLLPENFNESRYIYLSSILIVVVEICTIPTTVILFGEIADSITALTTLFFGISPMLCLFLPKIYVIYYRPELNNRQIAMAEITSYNFKNSLKTKPVEVLADASADSVQPDNNPQDQRKTSNQVHPRK
ncbi:uncharacterized protein TRIADDRAFT_59558 [Trichoplax adhaerens]|uniref:G-protein coupled receptors family 3 profile domain-containing protein n=1 Tax=Trichoplax adhaerens TaxID=10228 RepID=B3S5Z3_TRIAD|nr:hypothetical protein TRIADDRAFT_59558 [Trichoplax adhaerens]EDV21999.1 hypothetical protein TRIADDRAFT_59558 [Trichoplax adhaerens]|eukprot:XP_002115636.1 hypothetical protein TRIADDRAFT_59558 [Trichoplax adhaerens]